MDRRGFLKTTLTGLAMALAGPYIPTVERVLSKPVRTRPVDSIDKFDAILREAYAPKLFDELMFDSDPVFHLVGTFKTRGGPPWQVARTK